MQQINLYQEPFGHRRDALAAPHLALALVLLVLALAAVAGGQYLRLQGVEARAAALEAERRAANQRLAQVRERLQAARTQAGSEADPVAPLRAELAAKRRLLEHLDSGPIARRGGFSPYLEGLARRTVEGVWLSAIEIGAGGRRLRFEGHAVDAERVPALMAALGEEDSYSGHAFRTLAIDRPADADWRVDFVLASRPADADGRPGARR